MSLVSPLETLAAWIDEARGAGVSEPEAMALATVGADGRPSARFVLCRGIDARGLRFFTNYDSRKGRELAGRPQAAVVFHWEALRRQVRVEGDVEVLGTAESDVYFHSRARGSQLAASVSPQSAPIADLEGLRSEQRRLEASLAGAEVPRPANWGGYLLVASAVELWTSGRDRLHDRMRYERSRSEDAVWVSQRLAP
jgi:pyridoxamine 5'-phosphate oxidase